MAMVTTTTLRFPRRWRPSAGLRWPPASMWIIVVAVLSATVLKTANGLSSTATFSGAAVAPEDAHAAVALQSIEIEPPQTLATRRGGGSGGELQVVDDGQGREKERRGKVIRGWLLGECSGRLLTGAN